VDIPTGQGAKEGGERREAKTAVQVRDEACLRKTAEGEESSMRGNGEVGGRLDAGEEGESGGGRVEDRDRGRSEDG
jgi:hypothetical protein